MRPVILRSSVPALLGLVVLFAGCSPAPVPTGTHTIEPSPTPSPEGSSAATPPAASATTGPAATTPGALKAANLELRMPEAVSRAVAFVDGGSVLLAGGLTPSGTVATVLRIDFGAGTVTSVGRLATAVHDAGGALVGGAQVVFGGGNVAPERVVQEFQAGHGTIIGQLPRARADLVAIDVGSETLVIGGGTPSRLDPVVLATIDGVRFQTAATLPFGVRYPAVAVIDGEVVVVGGTTGTRDRTEIQAIDLANGSVRVIGKLPTGLSHAAAFVIDGKLLVAGGRTGGVAQNAIWEIDPVTGTVTMAGRLPQPVSDAAPVVIGDVGYLIGGEGSRILASIISISFE